jgi:hypothetical protein
VALVCGARSVKGHFVPFPSWLGFVVHVGVKVERPTGRTTLTPTRTTSSCPGGNGTMSQVRSWLFSLCRLDFRTPSGVCGRSRLVWVLGPAFLVRRHDGRWGASRGVRPRHSYEAEHRIGVEQCHVGSWPHAIHRRRGDLSITHRWGPFRSLRTRSRPGRAAGGGSAGSACAPPRSRRVSSRAGSRPG